MDFTLFEQDAPNTDPFTGPSTGIVKSAGMGIMRGGVKLAKGSALLGSAFAPSEGDEERTASRILPRREDFYRFIDGPLEQSEKFWTPDPQSVSKAGRVVGALAELPLQLVGGMPGITGAVTGNTGMQLVNEGVDAGTAGTVAAGIGAANAAMAGLPQGGSTLLKTGLLALLNPATGAATDLAAREALKAQGYEEQAKSFDPFDPAARSVDLALGIIFGGVAHYGKWREQAPTAVVDAIDTVEKHKHAENLNPFRPDAPEAAAHPQALAAALDALDEGRPVKVAEEHLQPLEVKPDPGYTADRFRNDVKDVFGLNDEQADAALALTAARARVEGKDLDSWIAKNLAGVEQGAPADAALYQDRPMVQPFYSKVLAEVESLQQEKWSGPELLAKLKKTAGVKGEELAWTGLDEFLTGKQKVTREEVRQYLKENQVQVQEVVKDEAAAQYNKPELLTPGGENQRELLLTLPDKGFAENYYGPHYREENVLAHVRFNERTAANGERVLHLEEVQSDWHQAGRDKGYNANVPEAPFAKSWHELALKRMLRWAAEHGFDRLTWTTGEQQADRYDLSRKLDEITYVKNSGERWHIEGLKDGAVKLSHVIPDADLPDAVGKDMAAKIRRGEGVERIPGSTAAGKSLKGIDLKIGGEGMSGFYDRMLPQYLDKFGRKFGAKVEDTTISTGKNAETVHSIPITDAMKDALLYEGQPLFQGEKGAVSFLADGRAVIHALEAPDFTTLAHELAHVFERTLTTSERKQFDTWMHSQVPGAKWSTEQRETFARAFERYLAEGKAPLPELQGIFDKFKQWLLEVYQRITGTAIDAKMNDNVRDLFDRMLFADRLKAAQDEHAARLQAELKPHAEELQAELRETWGDDYEEEPPMGVIGRRPETEKPAPSPLAGPLGETLDVANTFARNPRQVPEMLRTFLDFEADKLEQAESGKHTIDGYQKSATWSNAQDWYIERNRALKEQGGTAVGKGSVVNALRKAARGEYDKLTPGQQDMVLAAVDDVSRQIHGMSREVTGAELQAGDSFTTVHLEKRTVTGERDGRLLLDSGEVIPKDKPFRIVGEVETSGRVAEAPTNPADIILQSRGDFEIADGLNSDGSPKLRSAKELLDEARDAVVIEQNRKPLYHRAAVCMGLGG